MTQSLPTRNTSNPLWPRAADPCLAGTSPPLIWLHLSVTKITALNEGTHLTKTFLTSHQDETTFWSHETRCWQLSLLRAAHVCVLINKGAAAPWSVGFTVRGFVPNFCNIRGRNSQPCPKDLDMKRSSEHMNTAAEVPSAAWMDGVCASCRVGLSRGCSQRGQRTAGHCMGSG